MREHILMVAEMLFQERGHGVGLDEIAADAGITSAKLRQYFTSPFAIAEAVGG